MNIDSPAIGLKVFCNSYTEPESGLSFTCKT